MNLWGQKITRRDLESYMGDLRQVADIRLATLDDGPERGVRVAEVRTGSGFDFTVLLDRAMDIGMATYNGIPLSWQSGAGAAHPSRYEPGGRGWLRTFHGGLLALCGLTQVGPDMVDPENGEILGLHGRIGAIPAHDIRIERDWDSEHPTLRLRGAVDETVLFGYKLHLERTMEIVPGEAQVWIHDTVRNAGGEPAPLMVLYHCNLGWPLVSPDSEMTSPTKDIKPRDAAAEPGIGEWHKFHKPTPGYAEQVFFHRVKASAKPVKASMVNKVVGIGLDVMFDSRTLPYLCEWKQMGYGDYTVGIEPSNALPEGRVEARKGKRLTMLAPNESVNFTIGFRAFKS